MKHEEYCIEMNKRRNKRKLSTEDFSAACGVSRQTVSYWESGHTKPWPRHQMIIRTLLGKNMILDRKE